MIRHFKLQFLGSLGWEKGRQLFQVPRLSLWHSHLKNIAPHTISQCSLTHFWWVVTMTKDVKFPLFGALGWGKGHQLILGSEGDVVISISKKKALHILAFATCNIFGDMSQWWGMSNFNLSGPRAEGREATMCQVPKLRLGIFTSHKNSITQF